MVCRKLRNTDQVTPFSLKAWAKSVHFSGAEPRLQQSRNFLAGGEPIAFAIQIQPSFSPSAFYSACNPVDLAECRPIAFGLNPPPSLYCRQQF
jgi:hypothetical protein